MHIQPSAHHKNQFGAGAIDWEGQMKASGSTQIWMPQDARIRFTR